MWTLFALGALFRKGPPKAWSSPPPPPRNWFPQACRPGPAAANRSRRWRASPAADRGSNPPAADEETSHTAPVPTPAPTPARAPAAVHCVMSMASELQLADCSAWFSWYRCCWQKYMLFLDTTFASFYKFYHKCASPLCFFAGIITQIITMAYFENTIYHRLLALNLSMSTFVAHTNWKYYRILMKHSGTALAPSIMQGRKLMDIFSHSLIMSALEELVKRIHRYNAQN